MDGVLVSTGSLMVGRAGFSPGAVTLNGANLFNGSIEATQGQPPPTLGHVQALGAASNSLLLDNGHPKPATAWPRHRDWQRDEPQHRPGGAGFVAAASPSSSSAP